MNGSVYKDSILRETAILKNVNHTCIPSLIDIVEDDDFTYLIEQYFEGETLYDVIKKDGLPGFYPTVYYVTELAKILEYLHSESTIKICHLDIQPKNILINGENLYLIDFGNSISEDGYNKCISNMATVGYAPVWQYEYGFEKNFKNGIQIDIYGLCAVFCFMLTGSNKVCTELFLELKKQNIPPQIYNMMDIVLGQKENTHHYTMEQVIKVFEKSIDTEHEVWTSERKIISVAGIKAGAGTTHVSLFLATALKMLGKTSIYEENNNSNFVRTASRHFDDIEYDKGCFIKDMCCMKPRYNKNVKINTKADIIIRDEGILDMDCEYGQMLIIILNEGIIGKTALCEKMDVIEKNLKFNKIVLFGMNRGKCEMDNLFFDTKRFVVPYIENPFKVSNDEMKAAEEFLMAVCGKVKETKEMDENIQKTKKLQKGRRFSFTKNNFGDI